MPVKAQIQPSKVERVVPNALFATAVGKRLEDKPLGKLGALSRFDKPVRQAQGPEHCRGTQGPEQVDGLVEWVAPPALPRKTVYLPASWLLTIERRRVLLRECFQWPQIA